MDTKVRAQKIALVLWQILGLNVVVALAKAAWGLVSGSTAMLADGIHSLTDGASNIVALVAMRAAGKPVDQSHPYGHHKYESFASAVIGVLLLLAAYRVGSHSVAALVAYAREGTLPVVHVTATSFVVMLITLAVNLFVVNYEGRRGRALGSDVLQSDAKHTLSDVWVTVGVILSLMLVRAGISIADPIVGLFVAFAIVVAALQVFRGVQTTFSDAARIDSYAVRDKVLSYEGVRGCHNIRTRGTGSTIHMDLSVLVDPQLTIEAGHAIASGLERWLLEQYPGLCDVVVHVEPDTEEQRSRPFLA